MAETSNYKLFLPGLDSAANMDVFDDNLEIIDSVMKANSDKGDAASAAAEAAQAATDTLKTATENGLISMAQQIGDEQTERKAADTALQAAVDAKAAKSHTHSASEITSGTFNSTATYAKTGTDYSTARIRNIKAGTADLTAGVSALNSGDIYLVYE